MVTKIKDVLLDLNKTSPKQRDVPTLAQKGVVYALECKLCQDSNTVYIGETKRKLSVRIAEHLCQYQNMDRRSPVCKHALEVHNRIDEDT